MKVSMENSLNFLVNSGTKNLAEIAELTKAAHGFALMVLDYCPENDCRERVLNNIKLALMQSKRSLRKGAANVAE